MVKKLREILIVITLILVMTWNYSTNILGPGNKEFDKFDKYSECLVTTTIKAEKDGFSDLLITGLNRYIDVAGMWDAYDEPFVTNDVWNNGYHSSQPELLFRTSDYIRDMTCEGNIILFENGDCYEIVAVASDESWTMVLLGSETLLDYKTNGDLANILFFDSEGNALPTGYNYNYYSQFGLQGYVYRYLGKYINIKLLYLLTALLSAVVFCAIVYMLYLKYNFLFAASFYVVFLISPWVVNFANNLYWVEYTWFVPMLVGLICSWKLDDKKVRIICYVLAFLAIMVKCLCGYEYISSVMVGLIIFLMADIFKATNEKNKDRMRLLIKTTFIIGIVSLAGFCTAMCLHARTKPGSNGNIAKGLRIIYEEDIVRRTVGIGNEKMDNINEKELQAMNTSVGETLSKYFVFDTDIITGIPGDCFLILCIIPVLIALYDLIKKNIDFEMLGLILFSFFASVSWIVLAKNHSYVHTHLNYVLWYFGFIQICFYIILSRIIALYNYLIRKMN